MKVPHTLSWPITRDALTDALTRADDRQKLILYLAGMAGLAAGGDRRSALPGHGRTRRCWSAGRAAPSGSSLFTRTCRRSCSSSGTGDDEAAAAQAGPALTSTPTGMCSRAR